MLYFLYGESSYHALRKITDFKKAYIKKNGSFLIEEYDGEAEDLAFPQFHAALGQANLFSKTRLVIFKNVLGEGEKLFEELKERGDALKTSKDVFVFWEREPGAKVLIFFKKYSEKTQEVVAETAAGLDKWLQKKAENLGLKLEKSERELMMEEAGEEGEWVLENELEKILLSERSSLPRSQDLQGHAYSPAGELLFSRRRAAKGLANLAPSANHTMPSPFAFIDKMFGPRALLALKEMSIVGIEPAKFIYAFLWKLKQKRWHDAYFEGILVESQIRRDPKNAEEILEKFIFSLDQKNGLMVN